MPKAIAEGKATSMAAKPPQRSPVNVFDKVTGIRQIRPCGQAAIRQAALSLRPPERYCNPHDYAAAAASDQAFFW